MKRILLLFSFIILLCCITNVDAAIQGRVIGSVSYIRKGPGDNYQKIGNLYYQDAVTVLDPTPVKSQLGCPGGWYKLYINGNILYGCAINYSLSNTTIRVDRSKTTYANVRSGPGTNYSIYKTVGWDMVFTLAEHTLYKGEGCQNGWYRLHYNESTNRYICSDNVTAYNTISNLTVSNINGAKAFISPNSSSKRIDTIRYGHPITAFKLDKYKGSGCSAGWYKAFYKKQIVHICSSDVVRTNYIGVITDDGVNLRKNATTSSSILKTFNNNALLPIASLSKVSGSGCSAGWYKVNYNGGNAYICSAYVKAETNPTPVTNPNTNPNPNPNPEPNPNPNPGSGTTPSSGSKTISSTQTNSGYMYTISNWTYRVNENYANVRSGAGTNYSWQDTLYLGTELDVLGTYSGSGCSAGWYKIKYFNNKTGYICKSLVDKYEDITKNDSTYCNKLKAEGFPESYCPYLSYLHSKHPNWVFKAEKTGVTLLAAVNGESSKNYTQISTSYMPYLKSSALAEAGGWRTASDAYVAFMLDPRSYMNEKNIFAFEDLAYDKNYHTKDAIKNMVAGSYLNNDTYAGYFLSAGQLYNVSPVHLAARVKQEGGTNANYDSVSGNVSGTCSVSAYVCRSFIKDNKIVTDDYVNLRSNPGTNSYITTTGLNGEKVTILDNKKVYSGTGCSDGWYRITLTRSLKGIYNYYNIGAYGSNPVLRGLQTAAGCIDSNDGTPWNTREKAIKYGASFIANGYINKGQNTMYYQKFNTGPNATASRYTHQYMTNILAPASESLSTYESYKSLGLLDKGYVFKIPVYNSMPNTSVTHPPVK